MVDFNGNKFEVPMNKVHDGLWEGRDCSVYWPGENMYYGGTISSIRQSGQLDISYGDGDAGPAFVSNTGRIVEGERTDMSTLEGVDATSCLVCGHPHDTARNQMVICENAEKCQIGLHVGCANWSKRPCGVFLCVGHAAQLVCINMPRRHLMMH